MIRYSSHLHNKQKVMARFKRKRFTKIKITAPPKAIIILNMQETTVGNFM
jgi:hypothetical protein